MPTVKEFREWLWRFPDDAEVEVAMQQPSSGYQSFGEVTFLPPILKDADAGHGFEYIDMNGNPFANSDHQYHGKKFLRIGERL